MLLDLLGGKQPSHRAVLPTSIVERESTAPAPPPG
jgi:DNA-binding LacI/PurR family transcriptional regulator